MKQENKHIEYIPKSYRRVDENFTHEDYDNMDPNLDEAYNMIGFNYRIMRMTLKPKSGSRIETIREMVHHSPTAVRERATILFKKELKLLEGKYLLDSPSIYDPDLGEGYYIFLVLYIGEKGHVVECSGIYNNSDILVQGRETEKAFFSSLKAEYPSRDIEPLEEKPNKDVWYYRVKSYRAFGKYLEYADFKGYNLSISADQAKLFYDLQQNIKGQQSENRMVVVLFLVHLLEEGEEKEYYLNGKNYTKNEDELEALVLKSKGFYKDDSEDYTVGELESYLRRKQMTFT